MTCSNAIQQPLCAGLCGVLPCAEQLSPQPSTLVDATVSFSTTPLSALLCLFARAAVTKYHRLSGLTSLHSSQLWRLEVQDQGVPLCIQISSSYKDASQIRLGPTVTASF